MVMVPRHDCKNGALKRAKPRCFGDRRICASAELDLRRFKRGCAMLQRRVSIAGPICFALPSLSIRRLAEAIADATA